MSDERLRGAEREAVEHGGLVMQVRLLTERVRTGNLSAERLALAAYCGDEAAWQATTPPLLRVEEGYLCCCGSLDTDYEHGRGGVEHYTHSAVHACDYYNSPCDCDVQVRYEAPYRSSPPQKFTEWVAGLTRWKDIDPVQPITLYVPTRALIAAGHSAIPAWSQRNSWTLPRNALDAASTWLADPTEENYLAWFRAWSRSLADVDGPNAWTPKPRISEKETYERIRDCARIADREVVRKAIQTDLIAWALSG